MADSVTLRWPVPAVSSGRHIGKGQLLQKKKEEGMYLLDQVNEYQLLR